MIPNETDKDELNQKLFLLINRMFWVVIILVAGLIAIPFIFISDSKKSSMNIASNSDTSISMKDKIASIVYWKAPDINSITDPDKKKQILYGRDLIAHTSKYLGPAGKVMKITNGMNCQNCHLEAGTKVFGNNYGSVAPNYPKFRARSGTIENIYKRVNDCIQRSLNGKALDTTGKEMQAIAAYINFLGKDVEKGKKAEGSGFKDLAYLDRAADPTKGQSVFMAKCQSCHQSDGQGMQPGDKIEYVYPPLWGDHSFNDGAGLNRISNFAKYVKYNMPLGVNYLSSQLSDEEAWDVSAFVLSQTRPKGNISKDWPDISKKPVDHPFGPYADIYAESQHKFGPFKPIVDAQKNRESLVKDKVSVNTKK